LFLGCLDVPEIGADDRQSRSVTSNDVVAHGESQPTGQ
jgi:hypothetical protein